MPVIGINGLIMASLKLNRFGLISQDGQAQSFGGRFHRVGFLKRDDAVRIHHRVGTGQG